MNISVLFNNFLGGEVTPLMDGSPNTQAYQMGARRLENFLPMITGGVRKRPGTWYDGTTRGNAKARLIDWLISDRRCLVLEITAGFIRIWDETNAVIQEFACAYTEDKLADIKYASASDSLWLVHPAVRPYNLVWNGSAFSLTQPSFTYKNFASAGNYPGTVAFYSGRLCFAGTANEPNRIYLSMPPNSMTGEDRYTDFTMTENAYPNEGICLEENDMHGSRLAWLAAHRRLLASTERATWCDTGAAPTPADFDMNIVEYAGASGIQPKGTKDSVVYANRDGKALRALIWQQSSSSAGYVDMDISQPASHLFTAGIKDIAVMDYPYPVIWIVLNDGTLLSCVINAANGIMAYSRHPTDGTVEAAAVCQRASGDVLYLVVNRDGTRNIEHLIIEDLVNADYDESHYVDAGERHEFDEPTKTITGLDRFAGKTVHIFADGAPELPMEVGEDGSITLPEAVSKVHLGLPYKSVLIPSIPQVPSNGSSFGKKRRIEQVKLQLYRTLGGKAGVTEEKAERIITQKFGKYNLGQAPEPYTGEVDITVSGSIDPTGKVVVVHDEPAPFTALALVERVAILEV